jgi:uncharacterized protein (TIGR03067 family)
MILRGLAVLAIGFLLAAAGEEQAVEKDFQALHGVWTVTAAEKDGQPLDRIVGGKLTIKEVNFTIVTKGGTEMKGDVRLSPLKKPRHMDLAHQDGLLRDKTWQAIYALDGDELKICYAEADSGKDRPTEFKTQADSGLLLVILKRDKAKARE